MKLLKTINNCTHFFGQILDKKRKTIKYKVNNKNYAVHPVGIVDDSSIKEVWEELRKELKENGYSVDSVKMPDIVTLLLLNEEFDILFKKIRNLPNSIYKEEQEYGTTFTNPIASALTIQVDKNTFHILICKDRCLLKEDLRHELLHPWERVLGLSWGILTSKLRKTPGISP